MLNRRPKILDHEATRSLEQEHSTEVDREALLRAVLMGDVFHAQSVYGEGLICVATLVSEATIEARTVTTQKQCRFDRNAGVGTAEGSDLVCTIDSVAPLPAEIRSVVLGIDRRLWDAGDIGNINLDQAEERALRSADMYYAARQLPLPVLAIVKQERRWLVEAIRRRLLPELLRRGFESVPAPKAGPADWEALFDFPFGRWRRRGPRGVEIVEVQLLSYGRAAFRLIFGVPPAEGLRPFNGAFAAEDVPGWLDEYYELYQHPSLWAWLPYLAYFSIKPWQKRSPEKDDYEALVTRMLPLLSEVDRALQRDGCGPHVRRVRINHPKP